MKKQEINKLLGLSLGAYAVAGFIYSTAFISKDNLMMISFYCISVILMITGMLALWNNYKKNMKAKLFIYLIIIGFILLGLITYTTIMTIF